MLFEIHAWSTEAFSSRENFGFDESTFLCGVVAAVIYKRRRTGLFGWVFIVVEIIFGVSEFSNTMPKFVVSLENVFIFWILTYLISLR